MELAAYHTQHGTDKEPPEKNCGVPKRLLKSIRTRLRVNPLLSSLLYTLQLIMLCIKKSELPKLMASPIMAEFPNPAEDASGQAMDLNDLLVPHPVSTYYLRVEGDSMQGAGISSGDVVVVDKSLDHR